MATAEQNADVVRRGYAAFNAADIQTLTQLVSENASWHTPGRSRIAGDHVGREAVFAQFGRDGGETNGTFRADLKHVFGSDNAPSSRFTTTAPNARANVSTPIAASSSR